MCSQVNGLIIHWFTFLALTLTELMELNTKKETAYRTLNIAVLVCSYAALADTNKFSTFWKCMLAVFATLD